MGGFLGLEIGFGQKNEAVALFQKEWASVECFEDLAGIPRLILAQKIS